MKRSMMLFLGKLTERLKLTTLLGVGGGGSGIGFSPEIDCHMSCLDCSNWMAGGLADREANLRAH